MKWTKFTIRDGEGRLYNGSWREPFSAKKAPRLWSQRRYPAYHVANLTRAQQYLWQREKYTAPFEVVEVTVLYGEE